MLPVLALALTAGLLAASPAAQALMPSESIVALKAKPRGAWAPIYRDSKGRPARWNPCKPVRWAYNGEGQQSNGLQDAKAAVKSLSLASGIEFKYRGATTSKPGSKSFPDAIDLRVGWAGPENRAYELAGYKPVSGYELEGVGLAYVQARAYTDGRVTAPELIRGEVVLNPEAGFGRKERRLTYLHELGHAFGLDHFNDAAQVMYPFIEQNDDAIYGPGDLAGLKKLGREAGCFTYPIR